MLVEGSTAGKVPGTLRAFSRFAVLPSVKTSIFPYETVSAAPQEQASSITQVSSNVDSLAEQAEQLETLLETFETSSEGLPRGESTAGSAATPNSGTERDGDS